MKPIKKPRDLKVIKANKLNNEDHVGLMVAGRANEYAVPFLARLAHARQLGDQTLITLSYSFGTTLTIVNGSDYIWVEKQR